jgi:predicted nucleic acid-binding protein
MIVIADTGPLNYLIGIGEIEILPRLYGIVLIPPSVGDELRRSTAPEVVRAWIENPPGWLETRAPTQVPDAKLLQARLGPGERDAILLAQELKADELILDDLRARKEAQRRQLHFIGTLGVLRSAGKRGLLDLKDALARLRQTNFHISEELLDRLLEDREH